MNCRMWNYDPFTCFLDKLGAGETPFEPQNVQVAGNTRIRSLKVKRKVLPSNTSGFLSFVKKPETVSDLFSHFLERFTDEHRI